jgi:hypothetical protein
LDKRNFCQKKIWIKETAAGAPVNKNKVHVALSGPA